MEKKEKEFGYIYNQGYGQQGKAEGKREEQFVGSSLSLSLSPLAGERNRNAHTIHIYYIYMYIYIARRASTKINGFALSVFFFSHFRSTFQKTQRREKERSDAQARVHFSKLKT